MRFYNRPIRKVVLVLREVVGQFCVHAAVYPVIFILSCGSERVIEAETNDMTTNQNRDSKTGEIYHGTVVGEIAHVRTEMFEKPLLVWFEDEETAKKHINSILVVYISDVPVRLCGVKTFGRLLLLEIANNGKVPTGRERIRRRIQAGMKVYVPPVPKCIY